MPFSVKALGQHSRESFLGCVCFDTGRSVRVPVLQNASGREGCLQLVERVLGILVPNKGARLSTVLATFEQGDEVPSDPRVAHNKTSVKICEAKGNLDVSERTRDRSFGDCSNAVGVHADTL